MITPPIPVALSLLMAAALAIMGRLMPRALVHALGGLTAVTVGGVAVSMIVYSRLEPIVFTPGGPPGIRTGWLVMVIDNAGATLVLITSVLVAASIAFAYAYFDKREFNFPALALAFLAGASGVSQSGNALAILLFFELLAASAYAMYRIRPDEPLTRRAQAGFLGSQLFGGFLVFCGLAVVYTLTAATNLAQIGRTLAGRADTLAVAAVVLVLGGFFIRTAVAPFHFWLADAHAVTPAPVSALFSGALLPVGIFAAVRIYWTCFSDIAAVDRDQLRAVLVSLGVLSAIAGAALCYLQSDIKRLLAYSTLSDMGLVLIGVGLLNSKGLAGAELLIMGNAVLKGGMFLLIGILFRFNRKVDEWDLAGRGYHMGWMAALFLIGSVALAGAPPFPAFWGRVLMHAGGRESGYGWLAWVTFAASALTAAALFRFGLRVFLAKPRDPSEATHGPVPAGMAIPAAALVLAAAAASIAPRLTGAAEAAAIHLQNREEYALRVLDLLAPYLPIVQDTPASAWDIAAAAGALIMAAAIAGWVVLSGRGARTRQQPGRSLRERFVWLR